jgi:acetyl/propionyl-CoA carboxylase alpha subunit
VEVGSQVGADTVIGIVETMKLMNSVPAGVAGVVAEFCVANAEFAAQGPRCCGSGPTGDPAAGADRQPGEIAVRVIRPAWHGWASRPC